jgi:predicted Ser/Thr protein kinase
MPSSLTCPSEEELLAAAAGEEPSDELRRHLAECPSCRGRLERRRAELAQLRKVAPRAASPPATTTSNEPPCDLVTTNGRADHPGMAATRGPAGSTVCEAPGPDEDAGFGPEAVACDDPPLPAAIGKYIVTGRFPPGGQAEVFRVVHPGLAKDLVLKLSFDPVEPGERHEIIEEGRITAEFRHPNLVPVYDQDFHDDRPYLVMEYIRGRNLDQLAREGRMEPGQATALLAKVAGAADYAHRKGIIHRDIKPRNILVDEAGEPRLIDFGMARLRHAWSEDPGRPGGTFAFMAPEQARVESPEEQEKVGPRSDVFALGAVLYSLLTGKAPFEGRDWHESWDRARRCDFDRKALDDPRIPRDLRRICLKAMAADPAGRFASALAFQTALKRHRWWRMLCPAAAGVAGLALLGVLVYQAVPRGTVPPSAPMPPYVIVPVPSPPSIPIAAQPMRGRIDLLVVKSKDGTRRRLRLEDRGAVPVRADDEVRIEARLDRPAYLYLFWLGSEGKVAPLYPWKDHDWSTRPAEERKVTGVELPEIVDEILQISPSPPGLETLVLLAREGSPLPREDEERLVQSLAGSPVPMPPKMSKAIWLEDGQEVVFGPAHAPTEGELGKDILSRGIPSPKARESDDPVLRIRAILGNKLQPLGSYIQAVLFPNVGV